MLQQPPQVVKQKLLNAVRSYVFDEKPLYSTKNWSYASFRHSAVAASQRIATFQSDPANAEALAWIDRHSIKREISNDFASGREVWFAWSRLSAHRASQIIMSAYEKSLQAVRNCLDLDGVDDEPLQLALARLRDVNEELRFENLEQPGSRERKDTAFHVNLYLSGSFAVGIDHLKRTIDSFASGECGLERVFSDANAIVELNERRLSPLPGQVPISSEDLAVFDSADPGKLARYIIDDWYIRNDVCNTTESLVKQAWADLSSDERRQLVSDGSINAEDELVDFLRDEIDALNQVIDRGQTPHTPSLVG